MTETEKLARAQKWMLYLKIGLVVAGVVIIFSVWKGCQNSKNQSGQLAEAHAVVDSIVKKIAIDSAKRSIERDFFKALSDQRADSIREIKSKRDSIGRALDKTHQSVSRLLRERKMLREMLPDSTWIKVAPAYVHQCDDCFDLLGKVSEESKAYKSEAENLSNISAKQVLSYEEALQKEKNYSDSLLSMARVAQGAYNQIVKTTNPRVQIYAGPDIGVWPQGFVWGAQALMRTKSGGRMYGFTYLNVKGQHLYILNIDFLLSLRRKK